MHLRQDQAPTRGLFVNRNHQQGRLSGGKQVSGNAGIVKTALGRVFNEGGSQGIDAMGLKRAAEYKRNVGRQTLKAAGFAVKVLLVVYGNHGHVARA